MKDMKLSSLVAVLLLSEAAAQSLPPDLQDCIVSETLDRIQEVTQRCDGLDAIAVQSADFSSVCSRPACVDVLNGIYAVCGLGENLLDPICANQQPGSSTSDSNSSVGIAVGVSVSILVVVILVGVVIAAVYLVKRYRKPSSQPSAAAPSNQQAFFVNNLQTEYYNQPQMNPAPPAYETQQFTPANQLYLQQYNDPQPAGNQAYYGHPLPYDPPAPNPPYDSQPPGLLHENPQVTHDPPTGKPHTPATAEYAPPSAPFYNVNATAEPLPHHVRTE